MLNAAVAALPFKEEYESSDGIAREAKHNFFARQMHDERLDTDIYVMTHLETPSKESCRVRLDKENGYFTSVVGCQKNG